MYNKLIYELANKQFISSKCLCDNLEINLRELKKQVDLINLIDKNKFHIESKTAKGYRLVTNYSISEVIDYLNIDIKLSVDQSIELQYLFSTDYLKIDRIAAYNYVSYSKAYSVYQQLKDCYNFETNKQLGQLIVITELERKQNIGRIIAQNVKSIDIRKDLNFIFKLFDYDYQLHIEKAIQILNDNQINIKSSMYVECLVICILDLASGTKLPETKVDKIFGCQLTSDSREFWNNFIFEKEVLIEIDLNYLLDEIYRNFGVKLKYSSNDFRQLERHLEELLARVTNGVILSSLEFDKLNNDFELKYPLASELSHYAVKHINNEYDLNLPSIERLYLAIHFQKLLSNANQKVKIIIVCEYGYAMSSLIANEIMMHLEDVEILCIKSLNDFQANLEMYINQVDLIVTTLDSIRISDVVIVSLPNYEIDKSIGIIKEAKEHILNTRFFNQVINHIVDIKIEGDNRRQILTNLSNYCIERNICDEQYFVSAEARELKGNVVQNKIVYLHGDNNLVKTNSILLVEFENEIEWLGKKANSMFIVFIKVDVLNTYNKQVSNLYKKTMRKEFIKAAPKQKIEILKSEEK